MPSLLASVARSLNPVPGRDMQEYQLFDCHHQGTRSRNDLDAQGWMQAFWPMRRRLLRRLLLCVMAGLWVHSAQAQQPFSQDPNGLNYRPENPNNARGTAPVPMVQNQSWSQQNPDGSWSYQQSWNYQQPPIQGWPGYGQPSMQSWGNQPPGTQSHTAATHPKLELHLKHTKAFVSQNLVLEAEVISPEATSQLDLQLPHIEQAVLLPLAENADTPWSAEIIKRQGKQFFRYKSFYQLTPLQAGHMSLPPLGISGKLANGQSFEERAAQGLELGVLPDDTSVRPWLPLANLELSANLHGDERIAEGQPISLVIEQSAEGMSGSQLPSVEAQLRSPRHRVYREKTEVKGRVDTQGRLIGSRIEHFTLVPQKGNRVQIPALRLDWWNTVRGRKETAIIPSRLLGGGDFSEELRENFIGSPLAAVQSWLFWLPLVLFAFVAGLYWSWVWGRGRQFRSGFARWFGLVFYPLTSRLEPLAYKLSPRRHLHRLRRWFANLLPRPYRLWYCVRAADNEQDPDDWAQVLRFLLNRRLGISAQRPMAQLAEDMIALHRVPNPQRLCQLMQELEQGIYGHETRIDDFKGWKKAFKKQIRPRPLRQLFSAWHRHRGAELPALNP